MSLSLQPLLPGQEETRKRIRACRVAMIVSLAVGLVEMSIGLSLGMASLTAEGAHTLLDALDSLIVLLTVHIAARPADRTHQFGHGKFEALGATVEATFIVAAAVGIAWQATGRLVRGEVPPAIPAFTVAVMSAAAVAYVLVSAWLMRMARETKSPAVLAEAMHLRTHIYITAGVAAGLLAGRLGGWPVADNLLALGIALCLVGIAGHVYREVFQQFTDAALPREEVSELAGIIQGYSDRFVEVHGLRTRRSGAERHIEIHLVVLPQTAVAAAHALGHEIEDAIAARWPTTRTTVHIEPLNTAATEHAGWMAGQPKVRTDDARPDEREYIH
jgi:cation diffusion facilitator family transporter